MNNKSEKTAMSLKPILLKRPDKVQRGKQILLGLIELFLKTGRAVGSETLRSHGFDSLSSATIRNYFAKLENKGFLVQQHSSGGRVPTSKAFKFYAETYVDDPILPKNPSLFSKENKEIKALLHHVVEDISEKANLAVFASLPRFDQDFIQKIKLLYLDEDKILAILITDYGMIRTQTFYTSKPIDAAVLEKVEKYFLWRLNRHQKPTFDTEKELKFAQRIYTEIMVRYAASSCKEQILKTGLSNLLHYPELNDTASLSKSLLIFEDSEKLRTLLKETMDKRTLCYWIGEDLNPFFKTDANCSVLAIPYYINQVPAGAISVLGPMRIDYRKLFSYLKLYSQHLSELLTKNIFKFKIPFYSLEKEGKTNNDILDSTQSIQLEDKSR